MKFRRAIATYRLLVLLGMVVANFKYRVEVQYFELTGTERNPFERFLECISVFRWIVALHNRATGNDAPALVKEHYGQIQKPRVDLLLVEKLYIQTVEDAMDGLIQHVCFHGQ